MDIASLAGILLALFMLVFGIISSAGVGGFREYLDPASAIITFGGAFSCTLTSVSLQNYIAGLKSFTLIFKAPTLNTSDMIGVSIQKDGMIYASYDNGMTKLLGQIATAAFANASGLEKEGDNLYSATLNSGEFDGIGVDITAGGGYMSTGQLEMSNVDLSSEFTEMITTQRGFQANSRIITVSDTLLEELTNLKR